jgi:hypothetical protein
MVPGEMENHIWFPQELNPMGSGRKTKTVVTDNDWWCNIGHDTL